MIYHIKTNDYRVGSSIRHKSKDEFNKYIVIDYYLLNNRTDENNIMHFLDNNDSFQNSLLLHVENIIDNLRNRDFILPDEMKISLD